jgi:O-antigen/teichoic acid export membrane protein
VAQKSEEDLDRELIELLNELRVALPGVQVLFAFLLILPFSQGFPKLTGFQKDLYLAALILTAIASVLLIAPSAFHRIVWRQEDKEWLLVRANSLSIAGTVFLAAAMTTAVWLITDFLFHGAVTATVTGVIVGLFAWFWYGWPLLRRLRENH